MKVNKQYWTWIGILGGAIIGLSALAGVVKGVWHVKWLPVLLACMISINAYAPDVPRDPPENIGLVQLIGGIVFVAASTYVGVKVYVYVRNSYKQIELSRTNLMSNLTNTEASLYFPPQVRTSKTVSLMTSTNLIDWVAVTNVTSPASFSLTLPGNVRFFKLQQ